MRRLMMAMGWCLMGAVLCAPVALAQRAPTGQWYEAGGDAQLTGWQKIETRITRADVPQIRELWKMKLPGAEGEMPSEPLFIGRLITEKGFKDEALVLAPTYEGVNLYGIDYELGQEVWQKYIDVQGSPAQDCPMGRFATMVIQPQATFNFGRRGARGARRGPPPPPPVEGPARVSFGVGSGFGFRMRGVFVLTADGLVREMRVTNGADYGAAVKFIPYHNSDLTAGTIDGNTFYISSTGGCGGQMSAGGVWTAEPNSVWSVNSNSDAYPVANFKADANLSEPAQSTDGKTLYVTTGAGSGAQADSVVALNANGLTLKDYYTPTGARAHGMIDVAPVVFAMGGHDLVAAYSADGRLVLLDGNSLGGPDHHTPLAQTAVLTEGGGRAWGRLASADVNGTRWVFVSVHGRPNPALHLAAHGAADEGAVLAFKVEQQGGRTSLVPAWASANLVDPSPADIASGTVFALANGSADIDARLVGLDLNTGAQIYSSGSAVQGAAHEASISLDEGHILFVTANNTLYSFGIGIEH